MVILDHLIEEFGLLCDDIFFFHGITDINNANVVAFQNPWTRILAHNDPDLR